MQRTARPACHAATRKRPSTALDFAWRGSERPRTTRTRWPLVFSGALMVCVTWEQAWATGHVAAACSALAAGVVVLLLPKGRHAHRVAGTVYVSALVVVNVAALSLHREDTFGVFHALAVVSLVTLGVGLTPLLLGKRSPEVLAIHAYCMTWSYAGRLRPDADNSPPRSVRTPVRGPCQSG